MTITILRRAPGQAIPRPFNRASSVSEMRELIVRGEFAQRTINADNLNTDKPVLTQANGVEFFAFEER